MKTVWKFSLGPGAAPQHSFDMPEGAQILRCDYDGEGTPALWALIETEAPTEKRRFQIVGTGHELPPHTTYIGSHNSGRWVWHVFEILAEALPETLPNLAPDQERAYRTLVSDGWELIDGIWRQPDDEPLTHEQIMALGHLREVGLAGVRGA